MVVPYFQPNFVKNAPQEKPYRVEPSFPVNLDKSLYFWGGKVDDPSTLRHHPRSGYHMARTVLEDTSLESWEKVLDKGLKKLSNIFREVESGVTGTHVVELKLSPELQKWREEQMAMGRILPAKKSGLTRASDTSIDLMGMRGLPECVLTNDAIFGSGFSNFMLGAYDAKVLYSNYCVDLGFYHEHGHHEYFEDFPKMFQDALDDPYARSTPGGEYRREVAIIGLKYTKTKIDLEKKNKANLAYKTARLNLAESLPQTTCECSILGYAAEGIALGSDIGGIINDFCFASPGTDVIDVGSDMMNSELLNNFLTTADICDTGIVSEEALLRIHDAHAHACSRMWTEFWGEPGTRMCATLFTWHIQDDRHLFLRRTVLGYCKVKPRKREQREADWEEVFDENYKTTGFSRRLENQCNCESTCDQVIAELESNHNDSVLRDVWYYFATGPEEYAAKGIVDEEREYELIEGSRIATARAYAQGTTEELTWLICHANQHAWQVNGLFEAAMWGSFLDDGSLMGKLDRYEG